MTEAATNAHAPTHGIGDIARMTGFEIVAHLSEGKIRPPSMVDVLPFVLRPPEAGKVELHATPDERFLNLAMTVHGGWIMTMLDTAMGLAGLTTLGPGENCPTHETSVKFVRPIAAKDGVLRVLGHVLSRGRTVITIEGKIEDMRGRLLAHGTSTCLIVRAAGGFGRPSPYPGPGGGAES